MEGNGSNNATKLYWIPFSFLQSFAAFIEPLPQTLQKIWKHLHHFRFITRSRMSLKNDARVKKKQKMKICSLTWSWSSQFFYLLSQKFSFSFFLHQFYSSFWIFVVVHGNFELHYVIKEVVLENQPDNSIFLRNFQLFSAICRLKFEDEMLA